MSQLTILSAKLTQPEFLVKKLSKNFDKSVYTVHQWHGILYIVFRLINEAAIKTYTFNRTRLTIRG